MTVKVSSKTNLALDEEDKIVFNVRYTEKFSISVSELRDYWEGCFGQPDDLDDNERPDKVFPNGPYTEELMMEIISTMSQSGYTNPAAFFWEHDYITGGEWELEIEKCAS